LSVNRFETLPSTQNQKGAASMSVTTLRSQPLSIPTGPANRDVIATTANVLATAEGLKVLYDPQV
jgi:hypothetical protein